MGCLSSALVRNLQGLGDRLGKLEGAWHGVRQESHCARLRTLDPRPQDLYKQFPGKPAAEVSYKNNLTYIVSLHALRTADSLFFWPATMASSAHKGVLALAVCTQWHCACSGFFFCFSSVHI